MSPDTTEVIKAACSILALLLSIASLIYGAINRRNSATKAAIDRVEENARKQLDAAEKTMASNHSANLQHIHQLQVQVGQINESLKAVPTHVDMAAIHTTLTAVSNNISRLEGKQEGTTRMVERMNDYMIQRGT